MIISNLSKSLLLLATLVSFVSCGSSAPMVNDVKVSTSQVDGDILVNLSADLSIGNLQLPAATIPIFLPKSGKEIGTVSLSPDIDGSNLLVVSLNVSETANLNLEQVALPNGSMIPLIGSKQVIVVPLGKGAELYISLSQNDAAIGVSIPIKTLDAVGAKVGTTAIMPMFNTNGVIGSAGVYTSKSPGQNGFALVADVSSFLGSFIKSNALEDHSPRQAQLEEADMQYADSSKKAEKKVRSELYKMHKRKVKLQL